MFNRVTSIATGTAELFRAEGELLVERARRLLSYGAIIAVAGALAGLSLVALAVAGTAALSSLIGWVAAVTVAGVIGLSLSLLTVALARLQARRSVERDALPTDPRARADEARARLSSGDTRDAQRNSSTANTSTTSENSGGDDSDSIADRVAEYVVSNPGASVAGISAAMAVLGPGKTLKYAGRAMMLAKLATKMVDHATGGEEQASPSTAPASENHRHAETAPDTNSSSHTGVAASSAGPQHAPSNGHR